MTAPDHEQAERLEAIKTKITAKYVFIASDGQRSIDASSVYDDVEWLAAQLAEAKERLNREITEAEQRVGAAEMEREELNARWVEKWQRTVDLHVRELSEARAQLAERERVIEDFTAFVQRARPLLGMGIAGTLGAQADALLATHSESEERP